MQKTYSLRKNKEFRYVYRRGKSVSSRHLVLIHVHNRALKIGFSVSKKNGNAVTRNKIKRRLKECVRPMLPNLKSGYYVVIARREASDASYNQLCSDFKKMLERLALLK